MTRQQIEAWIERRQAAWNRRDVEALTADHLPDGTVESPMFGKLQGLADIRKSYANIFTIFENWVWRGEPAVVDGHRVAVPFTAQATHTHEFFGVPPSGRRFETHGVLVFTLDDGGRIVHERRIYDFSTLLIQIGVLKAKPP